MARDDIFGTKHRVKIGKIVMLKRDSKLYSSMKDLTKSERAVLDYMIKHMAYNLNVVTMAGHTRDTLLVDIGLDTRTVSNILSRLKAGGYIDKTAVPNEYLINPSLAIAGNEFMVYRFIEQLENELRIKNGR